MSNPSTVTDHRHPSGLTFHDLSAGGETGRLIQSRDWSATPLGPMSSWPADLKTYLKMILELPTPAGIFWGENQVQLYNDGYSAIMGSLHPESLGKTFRKCRNIYPAIYPSMQRVLETGETVKVEKKLIPLLRSGFFDEAYFTFSLSPLRDDRGAIAGILQLITEVTGEVLGERRAGALHELAGRTAGSRGLAVALDGAAEVLVRHKADLPFFFVYLLGATDPTKLIRMCGSELPAGQTTFPPVIDLLDTAGGQPIPEISAALHERTLTVTTKPVSCFGAAPGGPWPEPPRSAAVAPLSSPDQQQAIGVLVAGINPHLAFDKHYREFLLLVAAQLTAMVVAARAYEHEKKRADALVEIHRTKAAFRSLRLLYDLSVRQVTPENLREVAGEILGAAIKLTDADLGTFQLLDRSENVLKMVAHHGFQQSFLDFFAIVRAGPGAVCSTAFAQRRRVFVENIETSPVFAAPARAVLRAAGVAAAQSTPLVSRTGRLVGMLTTLFRQPRREDDTELHYIDLLAGQAADIIEQVQTREALQASEKKYRLLFDAIEDGFYLTDVIFDADGAPADVLFLEANHAAARITGQDATGKLLSEINPAFEPNWLKLFSDVATTGESTRQELYAAKYKAWYELHAFHTGTGHQVGVTFRDITARKQHRRSLEQLVEERTKQLKRSERYYGTVIESLPMVISQFDTGLRYLYKPEKADNYLPHENGTMIGKTWDELGVPAEMSRPWREKLTAVLQTGRPVEFETRIPNHQSEIRDYIVHAVPVFDDQGKIESLFTFSLDITELKQAHEALRQSDEKFHKIFQSSPDIINIINMEDETYIDVNQAFVDIFGYRREEVLGRTPAQIGLLADGAAHASTLYRALETQGKLLNFEINFRAKSGQTITTLCSTEIINLDGKDCRLSIMKDITKEKELEAKLLRLDRLNTVGEMAAAIGHEVRNPMTTVRGYLQLFQRKAESAKFREQFETMIEELDRANAIISEFLSLAKNKTIELKCHNLNDIIGSLAPLLQSEAYRTGHNFRVTMGDIPAIAIDEKEIRQLLLNLARNGFEAMDPGGLVAVSSGLENGKVVLSVRDTGRGIPPEILAKLGTPFLTTKENGSGLGLPVCYRIAERHGAKIDIETSPQGTTFAISFTI